jgi:lysozyme
VSAFADLSHHNLADLRFYAPGHDRVVLKATEGTGYLDPTFTSRWRQAGELGLARVAYHYLRNRYSGADQWKWFLSRVAGAGRPGIRDWVCLDTEDTDTPARAAACSQEFVAAAAAAGYHDGLVYTGKWYADPNRVTASLFPSGWRRLWLSDYTAGQPDGAVEVPSGWTGGQIVARQFTDKASVPGVQGGCDYSRVLRDWLSTTPTPEDDMPTPDQLWNVIRSVPSYAKDVKPNKSAYEMDEWLLGANIWAARAARDAAATLKLAAATAAQLAALTALAQHPGGLDAATAQAIADDAARKAVDDITVTTVLHAEES